MPFEIDPIVIAPSSADHTDPRPPKRLVPAMTGPAMAKSSRSLPPTVNTWRPKSVRVATYCIPATKAMRIMTASGTPRSGHRPIVEFCLTSVVGPAWTVWSTSTGVARRWPAR